MTLIEVAVGVLLFGFIMAGAALVSVQGGDAYESISRGNELGAQSARAIELVTNELTGLDPTQMFPDPGTSGLDTMSFQLVSGFAGGNVLYEPACTIGFEYEPGEVDDGVDNDGDGLVDEGQVVLTRNAGSANATRAVLVKNVAELLQGEDLNGADDNGNGMEDEAGFCLQRDGEVVHIRLTLESVDDTGNVLRRTTETSIRMRNSL
jgi:hypothetical protein